MASPPRKDSGTTPPRKDSGTTPPRKESGTDPVAVPGSDRVRSVSTSSTSSIGEYGSPRRGRTFSTSSGDYRVVLLAVDASPNARIAFDWFLEHIHRGDDMIVLVHCPEAPRLPTLSFKSGLAPPVDEWKKILDEMNSRTRQLEEEYEGTCIQKKLRYKVRGEAMKNAGEGIIKIAEEEKASLIVMGSRGLSGVKRAILGSVSDFVVRNSVIPIVIIPTRKGRSASVISK